MTSAEAWLRTQVARFVAVRPRYEAFAEYLRQVLELARRDLAPRGIVQARLKSVPSFAEKALRKRQKYSDPVEELSDLAGGRLITHTRAEVEALVAFLRRHFVIDEQNSHDFPVRLRAIEFGYRSVHLVVEYDARRAPPGVPPPSADLAGLRAEVQLRTFAQHCWADVGHDPIYKSPFVVPDHWRREAARAAALLEEVDEALQRVVLGLRGYQAADNPCGSRERIRAEIELLQTVRRQCADPDGALARQIANLAAGVQDWQAVLDLTAAGDPPPPLWYHHGLALCRLHQATPNHPEYARGQVLLEQAGRQRGEIAAWCSLAETRRGRDDAGALQAYAEASQLDPVHPRAVSGQARLRRARGDFTDWLPLVQPALEAALRRCQDQAAVGVNLPDALFLAGEFLLLLNRPYEALELYAQAARHSADRGPLDVAISVLSPSPAAGDPFPAFAWARLLLALARSARFPGSPRDALPKPSALSQAIRPPAVIVAGGCDDRETARVNSYRELLAAAFRDFRGTILSGGTRSGVCALVGDLQERYGDRFITLAYLPARLPDGVVPDERYRHVERTDSADFSPLESLLNWVDLLAAGVAPGEVTLLGINGGVFSAFEYQLAHTLGARVGLLRDSGREVGRLVRDTEGQEETGPLFLPSDPETLKSFLEGSPQPFTLLGPAAREELARQFHDEHRASQFGRATRLDPALAEWSHLRAELRQSNRQVVDHIETKLRAIGRSVRRAERPAPVVVKFSDREVERMAEMEHGRWNAERLREGWTLGQRDGSRKVSPYLVAWAELPDEIKEHDRKFVRRIPELLAQFGLEIVS